MVLPRRPPGAGALLAALGAASALVLQSGDPQDTPSAAVGGAPADAEVSLDARSRRMATAVEAGQMQEAIDEAAERQAAQAEGPLQGNWQEGESTRPHIISLGKTKPAPCPDGEDCFVHTMTNQRGNMHKELIVQLNRGRLGHHMFQWAASLSIAKELKAHQFRLVIREDDYGTGNTTAMARLRSVVWSPADFEFLQTSNRKCHMWDKTPFFVDYNLSTLHERTAWGSPKGSRHIPAKYEMPPDGNLAAAVAQAITETRTPVRCNVWELDGYFLHQGFFSQHMGMVRLAFWDEPTAVKAEDTLRWLLWNEEASGVAVGIHIRFGDDDFTGRNLPLQYYADALRKVQENARGKARIDRPLTCVIFSDKLDEAMKRSKHFDRCKTRIPTTPTLEDQKLFHMMSLLPNIIIADSVLSFWAARISPNRPFVVAPAITTSLTRLQPDYEYLTQTPGWTLVATELLPVGHVARQKFTEELDVAKLPLNFLKLGPGFCNNGYYAGHNASDAVDVHTCAQKCLGESQCMFFSLQRGTTCSRYGRYAGECDRGSQRGRETHVTFARISRANLAIRAMGGTVKLNLEARKRVKRQVLAGLSSVDEMTLDEVSQLEGYVAPSSEWAF